jgi:hypothetical protein
MVFNTQTAWRVIQVNRSTGRKVVLNSHKTQAGARAYKKHISWFYKNALKNEYVVEAFVPALEPTASLWDLKFLS